MIEALLMMDLDQSHCAYRLQDIGWYCHHYSTVVPTVVMLDFFSLG